MVAVGSFWCLEGANVERKHVPGVGRKDSEGGSRITKSVLKFMDEVSTSLLTMSHCLRLVHAQRAH